MSLSKSTSRGCRFAIMFAGALVLAASIADASRPQQQAKGEPDRTDNLDAVVTGVRANVVEGRVQYERDQSALSLPAATILKAADVLETGSDGRAEVLLQPGYILRLGTATVCKLVAIEPDRFKLQLDRGSISFEILKDDLFYQGGLFELPDEAYQQIRVVTRDAELVINRSGIYRINAADSGTELVVRDGNAVINGQRIKPKRVGRTDRGAVAIKEFNPAIEDGFDGWCRERARALVVANRLLRDAPWILARKSGKDPIVDLPLPEEHGNSPLVLSAKPATINFVETGVEVKQGGSKWQELTDETDLAAGDALRTGSHSRTELLLLPNIYLRIDGDSEVKFAELSYEGLKANVLYGSVILDVVKFDSKKTPPILIEGASSAFRIVATGNYRLNVGDGIGEILLRKGKAIIGGRSVGGGRRVVAGVESSYDEKTRDNFDVWSVQRGEGQSFDGRPREAYLSRMKQNQNRSTGFWYLHPKAGYYTFVPFFSLGFRSPYGGRYANVLREDRTGYYRRIRPRPDGSR